MTTQINVQPPPSIYGPLTRWRVANNCESFAVMPSRSSASSKELVAIGPHLSHTATATERAEGVLRPTTTRALGLRNGKYGTMGTGELVPLRRKLAGKEKLDLLAGTKSQYSAASAIHSLCRGPCSTSHTTPFSA